MIRLGVVGCGWVAESVHLPVLRGLSGIEVHAACDTSDERLQHIRRRFGIAQLHRTWRDLVADAAIDAVLVATPADQHAAIARGAVIAGKHVLVEKPLSLTLPEAEAVAAVARDSGLVAMVGLNFRFHPLVRRLKDAMARGDLGRPLAAFVTLASMRDQRKSVTGYETQPQLGGGVFYDKVVHVLDVLRFLFDGEVVAAQATGRPGTPRHEFASLRLEMDSGVLVSGICGDQMFPDFTCLVLGDAGKAMINLTRPTGLLLYRKAFARHRMLRLSGYARQMLEIASTVSYFATTRGRLSSYRTQWETFRQGVVTRTPPRPNFDDGVAVTRTLQHLLASTETP
jgi:myo-inositol 2-dehydrogenase / D-chiro-inositol 1-dehydrogenase